MNIDEMSITEIADYLKNNASQFAIDTLIKLLKGE
jgi:hypothetical protein